MRGRIFGLKNKEVTKYYSGESKERNLDERGACSTHVREKRDLYRMLVGEI